MRPNNQLVLVPYCVFCGGKLEEGRTDMLYCSQPCKMRAYRWRKRQERYESKAIEAVTNLAGYLDYPQMFDTSLEKMRGLKKYIDDTLKLHGVTKVKVNGS